MQVNGVLCPIASNLPIVAHYVDGVVDGQREVENRDQRAADDEDLLPRLPLGRVAN